MAKRAVKCRPTALNWVWSSLFGAVIIITCVALYTSFGHDGPKIGKFKNGTPHILDNGGSGVEATNIFNMENNTKSVEMSGSKQLTTTVLADDGMIAEKDFSVSVEPDLLVIKDQTMSDFLKKPILVYNGTWTVGATGILYSGYISALLTNAIWANKADGYNLRRGTACFETQINATPFHQGKLVTGYLPGDSVTQQLGTSYYGMHSVRLSSFRMLPSVELDCRESASVIKIPYIAPTNWYNAASDYDWGRLFVKVLAPLRTGVSGDSNISLTVWAWFEDMEFAAPIVPQALAAPKSKRATKYVSSVVSKEERAVGGGLSKALSSISIASDALSAIPAISSVAGTASWVADVLSGTAAAFGWSKPPENDPPMTMVNTWNRFSATSDGLDPALPLSLRHDHAIKMTDSLSINSDDEMSFSFLKRQPCLVNAESNIINWVDTQVEGTSLLSTKVGPYLDPTSPTTSWYLWDYATVVSSPHTANYAIGPPCNYLAQGFNYWRGGYCLVLKFVKTDFHTGRFQVTWTPASTITTTPSVTTGQYSIREIVDLRDSNEVCLMLPFISEKNYLPVKLGYSGQLDIVVLNPLRRPDTCNGSVQLLMYVSAADDFELAMTGNDNTVQYNVFTPQMDIGTAGDREVVSRTIANCESVDHRALPSEQSMGEMFTSIRQLLMRNTPLQSTLGSDFNATATKGSLWPWVNNVVAIDGTGLRSNPNGGDMYALLANMYFMYRGDMRVMLLTSSSSTAANVLPTGIRILACCLPTPTVMTNARTVGTGTDIGVYGAQVPWTSGAFNHVGFKGVSVMNAGPGVVSWRVPYYTPLRSSLVIPTSYVYAEKGTELSQPISVLAYQGPAGFLTDYALYRTITDDFQFHFYIGCPPLLVSST